MDTYSKSQPDEVDRCENICSGIEVSPTQDLLYGHTAGDLSSKSSLKSFILNESWWWRASDAVAAASGAMPVSRATRIDFVYSLVVFIAFGLNRLLVDKRCG